MDLQDNEIKVLYAMKDAYCKTVQVLTPQELKDNDAFVKTYCALDSDTKKKLKMALAQQDVKLAIVNKLEEDYYKLHPTTITSTTFTTFTTLNPAGDFIEGLVLEPVGEYYYVWVNKGERGISQAYPIHKENKNGEKLKAIKHWCIKISDVTYTFNKTPLKSVLFFVPEKDKIKKWVNGELKPRGVNSIFKDIVKNYEIAFDLQNKSDSIILALHNLTTYLRDILDSFFFIGIDATKGAGKTCLLRAMAIFSYHGKLAGDISVAFIARVIEKQKLTIFVDEIDQLSKDTKSEIEGILRKAQRRNNPYLRVNQKTFEPEQFEVHGAHAFSFRTNIEDALSHRTIKKRLQVSSDISLPVINYHVASLFKPLSDELLFYYLENRCAMDNSKKISSQVVEVIHDSDERDIAKIRQNLFGLLTQNFSEHEVKLMRKLVGRNIELCYVCLEASHILGLDIFKDIKDALMNKQEEEDVPDSFHLDNIRKSLIDLRQSKRYELADNNKPIWLLQKGQFATCFYYPKSSAYGEYITFCKENSINYLGTTKFNGFLKDLGFVSNYNIKNQKDADGTPVLCLIYDKNVKSKLGLVEENNKPQAEEKVKPDSEGIKVEVVKIE